MKSNFFFLSLISMITFISCHEKPAKGWISYPPLSRIGTNDTTSNRLPPIPDTIWGDYNGDGVRDWALLVPPVYNSDSMSCADSSCTALIRFSNDISPISIRQCIGGTPDNLGDLDGDGADEIGLNPDWFTSCWHAYYTWTFKANHWSYAIEPFSTHCIQWDEPGVPVKRDPKHAGNVIIKYSESTEDSIVVREKSVPIK
jgi:hypothetical protein